MMTNNRENKKEKENKIKTINDKINMHEKI
jgi:hypothetical protein